MSQIQNGGGLNSLTVLITIKNLSFMCKLAVEYAITISPSPELGSWCPSLLLL